MSDHVQQQLVATIQALEGQRALLGDAVVDTALAPLRAQLAALQAAAAPVAPPVAVAPAPEQSLRQVSILFLDVVGSTTLSQRLDPEEVHAVMDGALTRCTAIVQDHGGRVLQYAGDNLLAVFGAAESREDDAERAVHCGLRLLAEGRQLGREVLAAHGHAGFDVRVGVHTGSVLLGGGVDAEGSIRGMAVNVAARMEQSAPPGALRISQDTYRQVQGVFELQAQPPIQVKGVDEPIVTWLVQRARPLDERGGGRGIDGVVTPLIGRDDELRALQQTWSTMHAQPPRLRRLLVVAEAGLGKSRLLRHLLAWVAEQPQRCRVVQARALPQTQGRPYGLLREIFLRVSGRLSAVREDDTPQQARARIEAAIAPLFMADDGEQLAQAHAHLLGHLLGMDFSDSPHLRGILDDPAQLRSRGFHAAAQALRRSVEGDGTPLLLALDDLHWADEGTLDFLDHLVAVNAGVPMLLLALTRSALFERRGERGLAEGAQRLELKPLGDGDSAQLAHALLQRLENPPASLVQLLTSRAEGIPFYMEELVKMLVDQGALRVGEGRWTLQPERLHGDAVPTTLFGVLQARLDRLPSDQHRALQQASVVGMVFWEPALGAIDATAPQALPALRQRQLVHPRNDATMQGAPAHAFDHPILREVAYEGVLRRSRREMHARAAAWLASRAEASAQGLLGLAAEHYEKAGDVAQAVEYYTRAAEAARQHYAHQTTLHCVAHALPLIDDSDIDRARQWRWRLLDARERTLDFLGRRAEQRHDLLALADLAQALADDRHRAEVDSRRCQLAARTGDLPAAVEHARLAVSQATAAGDALLRLNAQRLLADALARQGELDAARELVRQGLAEAADTGNVSVESRFLNVLTIITARENDLMGVLHACREATRLRAEMGDRRNEATGLATLGGIWMALGQPELAAQALDRALKLHRAVGDRSQEPIALANLSQLSLWQGRPAQAREQALAALAVARDVQARELAAFACWCLGQAELAAPAPAAAVAAFEQAQQLALDTGSAYLHDARAGLARCALAKGDLDTARRQVQALLDHESGGGWQGCLSPRLIDLTCWQTLHRAGDERAADVLHAAHRALMDSTAALTVTDATGSDLTAVRVSELRASLLTAVPENRAVMQAWEVFGATRG